MNWDDLRIFLAVARAGQMLAASARLGVSQATVNRRISALERAAGCRLFDRTTAGCELTAEGTALLQHAEVVEAEMLNFAADIRPRDGAVSGTVRIGVPDGFGVAFLAPRLHRLAQRHPGLSIQLVPVPRLFSLSQREADIAVTVGKPATGRLIIRKLTDYSLRLYASPTYLAEAGQPADGADLSGHRLISYVDDLIFSPELDYAREIHAKWRSSIEISSALGQVEAVRAGAGIGILHDFMAYDDAGLVPVMPGTVITRSYWTVTHETMRRDRKVAAVSAFLAEEVTRARSLFVP